MITVIIFVTIVIIWLYSDSLYMAENNLIDLVCSHLEFSS
jgi:hypothetical protein